MFEEIITFANWVIIDTIHANQNDRDLTIIFGDLYYVVGVYITMTNLYIPYCHDYFFLRGQNMYVKTTSANIKFAIFS